MDIGHVVLVEELKSIIKEPITIKGDPNRTISGISPINEAQTADLTFCIGKKYIPSMWKTTASVIITTEDTYLKYELPDWKTYILVKNPRLAFIDCLNHYLPFDNNVGYVVSQTTGCVIHPSSIFIGDVTLGKNVRIGPNCTIGKEGFGFERRENGELVRFPSYGSVIMEDDVEIGANVCIDRGTFGPTKIGRGTKIDNLVHIAHNADIGENCLIVAHAMIAGSVKIGDNCWISASYIRDGVTVGDNTTVGLGAVVVKDVPSNDVVIGVPARSMRNLQ